MPVASRVETVNDALEGWVDAHTVARHLRITRREVLAKTRAGKLPGHPVDPNTKRKTWRYKLSEVDAAMSGTLVRKPPATDNADGSPRSRRG